MTNLATARAAERLGLTGGVRREVVVEHEALPPLARQRVDLLFVARGAQRGRHGRLRLAALEERRAVRPREDAHLAHDGTDRLHVAPVDALPLGEDVLADDVVLALLELLFDELLDLRELVGADFLRHGLDHLGLGGLVRVVALLLLLDERSLQDVAVDGLLDERGDLRSERLLLELALRLSHRRAHALDELEDGLGRSMREHQRLDDVGLGSLAGAALDHDDGVFRAGDDHVDVGGRLLLERGIADVLALDARHAHGDEGAAPGDVRDVQGGRCRRHREDVRGVLLVAGEHRRDDLRVVLVPLGEEGPARPVHEARGEDLVVALAALALEEAARDLARGERLLDVVAGEREKVDARPLVAADGRDEDHALAVRDEHRAVRLLGQAAGL